MADSQNKDMVKWTAIVVTCSDLTTADAYQKELLIRQRKGLLDDDTLLLTAPDPKMRVGSGGATLNALLMVAEYISAKQGYSVVNSEILEHSMIMVIHAGRHYAYDPCGRPFVTFPVQPKDSMYESLTCHIDILIRLMSEQIAVNAPPGVWVCSTEMIFTVPHDFKLEWKECDVLAVTVPETLQTCRNHGIYKVDEEGFVQDIFYRADVDTIESCQLSMGGYAVVCGIVYFSFTVSQRLLSFHVKPPLDACTYMGLDSGESPLQLSLFFDMMLAMATHITREAFVAGERGGTFGLPSAQDRSLMRIARRVLWSELHGFKIKASVIDSGNYYFLGDSGLDHHKYLTTCPIEETNHPQYQCKNITHSYIENSCYVDDSAVLVNSICQGNVTVPRKCVLTNCKITGNIMLGNNSLCLGAILKNHKKMKIIIGEDIIIQGFLVELNVLATTRYILTIHGRFDKLQAPVWKGTSTFCNEPWMVFRQRTGIQSEDLWAPDVEADDQTIMTARLFPVFHVKEEVGLKELLWMQGQLDTNEEADCLKRWRSSWRFSLKEIMDLVDVQRELDERRELFYEVFKHKVTNALENGIDAGFTSFYNSAAVEGHAVHILDTLDNVSKAATSPGVMARTLANIADVLGCMACGQGGIRSGPAANKAWNKAFALLEGGETLAGVLKLAKERSRWLDRPNHLIRAARHYEGAAQILIRQAVATGKQFFTSTPCALPAMNKWVVCECPARLDMAGGWSDTPPICYEHGGAVTNIALLINGKRPIGTKVRRIEEPCLKLVMHDETVAEETTVNVKMLFDMEGYNSPHTPGALLKAAFICAGIVEYPSDRPLSTQLSKKYGSGFEVHSWSNLPRGSGMGTSSILAGAVLQALLKACGKDCSIQSLNHMVLYLEQILTTGGGWQDQVGGLYGGVKLAQSEAKLPMYITTEVIPVSSDTVKALNDSMVLVYTGKTRLARNLLQDVVRNWYARTPEIVQTEDRLVSLAHECAHAFKEGDVPRIGSILNEYWNLKKVMAPGSEPSAVTHMMKVLRLHTHGMLLAGAGGGGFLFALMKDSSNSKEKVTELLNTLETWARQELWSGGEPILYDICIDETGMVVTVEGSETPSEAAASSTLTNPTMTDCDSRSEHIGGANKNQSDNGTKVTTLASDQENGTSLVVGGLPSETGFTSHSATEAETANSLCTNLPGSIDGGGDKLS